MRHAAVSFAVFLFVLTVSPHPRAAPQSATIADLYSAYAAGSPTALNRVFRSEADFRVARGELFQLVRESAGDWRPSRAGFLLHVVHAGAALGWADAPLLLAATRDVIIRRPTRIGTNRDEDAFEVGWHRTAVAILLGSQEFARAQAYLAALAARLSATPVSDGTRLYDPRLPLMQGFVADLSMAPSGDLPLQRPDMLPSLVFDPRNGILKTRADLALAAYAQATEASVVAEAGVRSAFLLHRLGRNAEALARLRATVVPASEPVIAYWSALFRGRIEEALNHPAEATAAYEAAAALVPRAQTPAVALASLHQRLDRPAEAIRWAAVATSMPPETLDPWWRYWGGDYWRVPDWLAELRKIRP